MEGKQGKQNTKHDRYGAIIGSNPNGLFYPLIIPVPIVGVYHPKQEGATNIFISIYEKCVAYISIKLVPSTFCLSFNFFCNIFAILFVHATGRPERLLKMF